LIHPVARGEWRVARLTGRQFYATEAGYAIKCRIERRDPFDAVIHHDRGMQRIARRQAGMLHQKVARAICVESRDVEDLRTNGNEEVIDIPRKVKSSQGRIAIEDFECWNR
jgi:hypothetical protein